MKGSLIGEKKKSQKKAKCPKGSSWLRKDKYSSFIQMKQELVKNTHTCKHIICLQVNSQIYSHPKHYSYMKKINIVSSKLHFELCNRGRKK